MKTSIPLQHLRRIGSTLFFLLVLTGLHATTYTVQVSNFAFSPSSLPNVLVGDTIKWVWVSGSHTTTSVSVPNGAATWDSPMNSSSTTFSYPITVAGTYTYKCSMHASMTGTITATATSGIESLSALGFSLSLYPNPVAEQTTVSIQSNEATRGEIRLYDMLGKMVLTRTVELSPGKNDYSLALEEFQKGLYLIELVTDGKQVLTAKILKK